jgi:hypothetical protein
VAAFIAFVLRTCPQGQPLPRHRDPRPQRAHPPSDQAVKEFTGQEGAESR